MSLTYSDWNFTDGPVDPSIGAGEDGFYVGENFVSSESVLVAAGPQRFGDIQDVIPIGAIQNANLGQNKNIQQIFEIGSKDTILLPGRTFVQTNISRILFNGPSLLKAIFRLDKINDPASSIDFASIESDAYGAGVGNTYLNLANRLFDKPIGLAFIIHDMENDAVGGVYLEYCLAQSHNLSIGAGQTVIAENVSLRVGKVRPIKFTAPGATS